MQLNKEAKRKDYYLMELLFNRIINARPEYEPI